MVTAEAASVGTTPGSTAFSPSVVSMIHADIEPATPLIAVGVTHDRYVFLLPSGEKRALTFVELCDPARLIALCGGEAWLRYYFPSERRSFDVRSGASRWVSSGIETVIAAQFLADLCLQKEKAAIQATLRAAPRRRWWQRLIRWIDQRFALAASAS
nr:hypothetical protein [uncultured Rhodopila sp.]